MKRDTDDILAKIRMDDAPRVLAESGDYQVWLHRQTVTIVRSPSKGRTDGQDVELSLTTLKVLIRQLPDDL